MLKIIGNNCRDYRVKIGYRLIDVAQETNYSLENIHSFESGRNDNYRILLWYLLKGMTIHDLLKGV